MEEAIAEITGNDPLRTTLDYGEFPDITEQQLTRSMDALKQNRHIRTVYFTLYCRHLTRGVFWDMAELLRTSSVINDARFHPLGMTNDEFRPIAEGLRENTSVNQLALSGSDIGGGIGGEMIKNVLLHNRSITELVLYSVEQLGSDGVEQIAKALRCSGCALTALVLRRCNIGNEGMNALCAALTGNKGVTILDVAENAIMAEGCRALASSLPYMKRLKLIEFTWYPGVTMEDFGSLIQGLLANRSLLEIRGSFDGAEFSHEQSTRWIACEEFVGARNSVSRRLEEFGIYTGGGTAAANRGDDDKMPIPLDILLSLWCNRPGRDGTEDEVRASLIYHLLRTRTNDAFSLEVKRGGEKSNVAA